MPCQFDGRLSAKSDHNAYRLLGSDHVHDVVGAQRLKIQAVAGIKVRTYCFRVVVDNNGFVAELFQRPYRVNGTVVKFYALADTDRAAAKYGNFLFIAYFNFVFFGISRIIVRSCGFKFCGAGINHLIGWNNTPAFAHFTHFLPCFADITRNGNIRKAFFLGGKH